VKLLVETIGACSATELKNVVLNGMPIRLLEKKLACE